MTKTGWPAKPKIFAIWPLLKFADPWLRIWTLMPFSTHLLCQVGSQILLNFAHN